MVGMRWLLLVGALAALAACDEQGGIEGSTDTGAVDTATAVDTVVVADTADTSEAVDTVADAGPDAEDVTDDVADGVDAADTADAADGDADDADDAEDTVFLEDVADTSDVADTADTTDTTDTADTADALCGGACPTTAATLSEVKALVIEAVRFGASTDAVVLRNVSGATVTVTPSWQACNRPAYGALTATNVDIAAGARHTFTVPFAISGNDELAIYTSSSYGSGDAMMAFVAWGAPTGSVSRESVAVGAGLWATGDAATSSSAGYVSVGAACALP